jgi:hypothetical protein
LRIGSGNAAPGHSVAYLEAGNVRSQSHYNSGGLLAEGIGKLCRITALTKIGVDKIDAGSFDTDESLAGTGSWRREIAESKDVGIAGGEYLDSQHECWVLSCEAGFRLSYSLPDSMSLESSLFALYGSLVR